MNGERKVWINGEMVPDSQAKVSIYDRGFVYGDAAFDVTRTYNHKVLRLDLYIERFFASLKYMGIDPGFSREDFQKIVEKVIEANLPYFREGEDFQVLFRCTRGANHHTDVTDPGRPTLIVLCSPFKVDIEGYSQGVDLLTSSFRRTPLEVLSPKPKTHDRLNNVLADLEARQTNPKARSLMLDMDGFVAEGSSYNIAAMVNGALVSPKDNCLEGRTMKLVVELANKIGIPARYDNLSMYDLYNTSEAFITMTSAVMVPVRSVNGRKLDGRIPGPVQERLWKEWNKMVGIDVREQARTNGDAVYQKEAPRRRR